ncbi:MAG TPA: hypothetical protein VFW55_01095 [Propionicimonas sp.]|nr:hypothetical protein [Propionicimonas sp.]
MTEQQPPGERPEFQPPGGGPGDPSAPPPQQPSPEPFPGAVPPVQPFPQPFPPAEQQPSQQYPPPAQPGSYPQFPSSAPPGGYPPYAPQPPVAKGGRGSIWLGIGITIAVVLVSLGLTTAVPYDSSLYSVTSLLAAVLPFALVLGGIVMAAIPRTTRTGAGILIGIGAGILIAGGLCFALVLGLGSGG